MILVLYNFVKDNGIKIFNLEGYKFFDEIEN